MDDEMLRALAKNGGVLQAVAFSGYVKVQPPARDSAVQALRLEFYGPPPARGAGGGGGGGRGGGGRGGGGRGGQVALPADRQAEFDRRMASIEARWPSANVQDFVNHIDHAVKIAGIDHVGISSDFDG